MTVDPEAFEHLPLWMRAVWAVMVVWFAGLGPANFWGNRRLADLAPAESSGRA